MLGEVTMLLLTPILLLLLVASSSQSLKPSATVLKTRAFALLFASIQCINEFDPATEGTREINRNFQPEQHLDEYRNRYAVERLLHYVNETQEQPDSSPKDTPAVIAELEIILKALYPNTVNWPLFFNTSAWLLGRVDGNQLYWALMIISEERFTNVVVVPSAVEVFPQLYLNKSEVGKVAHRTISHSEKEFHPLLYWMGDPGLNEFHFVYHVDNPFWWNEIKYGVRHHRKGELFLYSHQQFLARYNAERWSNGLPRVEPLKLEPNYTIPEPSYPDVINIDFRFFRRRKNGTQMQEYDDGQALANLQLWYERLYKGVQQGYFIKKDGSRASLLYKNGSSILGDAIQPTLYSPNPDYYGNLHNGLHRFISGSNVGGPKGVVSRVETAMRDPAFYQIHALMSKLYMKLKTKFAPYTEDELNYPGVEVTSVELQTKEGEVPPDTVPVLTTYFDLDAYDVATVAKPCRRVGEDPAFVLVQKLQHYQFNYSITVKSSLSVRAYGMVRIFLLPVVGYGGRILEEEESHQNAIALDVFRIQLEPGQELQLLRSSMNSMITRRRSPGIRQLLQVSSSSPEGLLLLTREMKRACGWPNNLLIPKGTEEGLPFKLLVVVSEEPEPMKGTRDFPQYPYCGVLNGYKYPDRRAMGYPFDRKGTRFASQDPMVGAYKNVKQMPIIIRHESWATSLQKREGS